MVKCFVVFIFCFAIRGSAGGITIKECPGGAWVDVLEDSAISTFTCEGITPADTVIWKLYSNLGLQGEHICNQSPCNIETRNLTITRNGNSSVLTVLAQHRVLLGDGTAICQVNFQSDGPSCKTNVISPGNLSVCNLTPDYDNWLLTGNCTFRHAFSSNNTYHCAWSRLKHGQTNLMMSDGTITRREEEINDKMYYQVDCSLLTFLPLQNGRYDYFIDFVPGNDREIAGNITIITPADPEVLCEEYVYEGQSTWCGCIPNESKPTSPPSPTARWRGFNSSEIYINLTRHDPAQEFVCQLVWGPPSHVFVSVTYTPKIAYGPDEVTIISDSTLPTPSSPLTLTCTATNVHPAVSFSWTGPCDNSSTTNGPSAQSSCTFTPIEEDEGKSVSCIAGNSEFPQQNKSATFVISMNLVSASSSPVPTATADSEVPGQNEERKKEDDDDTPVAMIAGITAGAVALIVILIVIIIVVRRKGRRQGDNDDRVASTMENNDYDDDKCEEHVNPVYGLGKEEDGTPEPRAKPSAVALKIVGAFDNTTETHSGTGGNNDINTTRNAAGHASVDHERQPEDMPGTNTRSFDANPSLVEKPNQASFAEPTSTVAFHADPDLYSSADEVELSVPVAAPLMYDDFDDYTAVHSPDSHALAGSASQEDDCAYAAVDGTSKLHTPQADPQDYLYSVVNKHRNNTTSTLNSSSIEAGGEESAEGDNVYAVVNKSGKAAVTDDMGDTAAQSETTEDGLYAQVNKTGKKVQAAGSGNPSGDQEMTHDTATDDDYNTLNFLSRLPHNDDSDNPFYSHVTHL